MYCNGKFEGVKIYKNKENKLKITVENEMKMKSKKVVDGTSNICSIEENDINLQGYIRNQEWKYLYYNIEELKPQDHHPDILKDIEDNEELKLYNSRNDFQNDDILLSLSTLRKDRVTKLYYTKYHKYIYTDSYNNILYNINKYLVMNKDSQYMMNFLIYGHYKIGKSILAYFLFYYMARVMKYNVRFVIQNNKYYYNVDKKSKNVVILVNNPIEEDEYLDADIMIVVANSYDTRTTIFERKRSPYIMFLSEFSQEEITLFNNYLDKIIIDPKKYSSIYYINYSWRNGDVNNKIYWDYVNKLKNKEICIKKNKFFTPTLKYDENSKLYYFFRYTNNEKDNTKSDGFDFISKEIEIMVCNYKEDDEKNKRILDFLIKSISWPQISSIVYENMVMFLCGYELFRYEIFKRIKVKKNDTSSILPKMDVIEKVKDLDDKLSPHQDNFLLLDFIDHNTGKSFEHPDIDIICGKYAIQVTHQKDHTISRCYKDFYKNRINNMEDATKNYFILSNKNKVTVKYSSNNSSPAYPGNHINYIVDDDKFRFPITNVIIFTTEELIDISRYIIRKNICRDHTNILPNIATLNV